MIRVAAITDEFGPRLSTALDAMRELGITGAELRMIDGRNIVDLSAGEVDLACAAVEAHGMQVVSIASPVLKCVLPDGPGIDERLHHDVFGSAYTIHDQARLAERAFEAAKRTGAQIVRVFSYWRTVDPPACLDRIVAALRDLGDRAAAYDVTVGVENDLLAIAQAERMYQAEHGSYASLEELNSSGALTSQKTGRPGYTYSVDVSAGGFTAKATCDTSAGTSCANFAVDQTMQVHQIQ